VGQGVGHPHRPQFGENIVEVRQSQRVIFHRQSTPTARGRQRGASLWVGQDARRDGAGAGPELDRLIRSLLLDDQLDQRRRVEVEGQRRCSATRSETEPVPFTRGRRGVRGESGMVTNPRRTRSSNGR
jgi:hypothetical protein